MRHTHGFQVASATCLAWIVTFSAGCAPDEPSLGQQSTVLLEGDRGPGGGRSESPLDGALPPGAPLLAAFDAEGALVLVDVDGGGAVLARRELGDAVDPQDVVVDHAGSRILVVVQPPPFEESMIFEVPVDGAELGEPRQLGKSLGTARVMPIEGGIVVSSDGDGPRVRLMRDDHASSRGTNLPVPLSWWPAGSRRVEGLGADYDGTLVSFGLEVDEEGSIAVRDRLSLGFTSEDARLVPGIDTVTAGGVKPTADVLVLHDEKSGWIGITDERGTEHQKVAFRARNLEGAIAWSGGIAFSTSMPPAVVSIARGTEWALPLPEDVRSGTAFGRHDLVDGGATLFVATCESVVAVRRRGRVGSMTERDPSFAGEGLRGPLALVAR